MQQFHHIAFQNVWSCMIALTLRVFCILHFCGVVLPMQKFHHIAFQNVWSCMIALTLRVFYISMYVKEVLLLMTGSAIDEDGSHHQQPYWDYLNQDKLF